MANKKEPSKFSRKVDAFCKALFLTEEGKPKSAVLLYSFCMALLFFFIYLAADALFVALLKDVFTEANFLTTVVEYLLPGTVAGIVCVCFCFLFREKKNIVSSAFIWLCAITLAAMITMLFLCDPADGMFEYRFFLLIVVLPFLVFLAVGTAGTQVIVRKWRKRKEEEAAAKNRPSYYNT